MEAKTRKVLLYVGVALLLVAAGCFIAYDVTKDDAPEVVAADSVEVVVDTLAEVPADTLVLDTIAE